MAFMFLPLAIEGLSVAIPAVLAAGSACALASVLGQMPAATRGGGGGGGSDGSRQSPPKLLVPPDPDPMLKKAIMTAILTEMMIKMLGSGSGSGARGPLVYYQINFKMNLRLKAKHEWCGRFTTGPPQYPRKEVVRQGHNPPVITDDSIVHQSAPPKGSKAAVAYAASGHQWIVAWHVPLYSGHNKIYVEDGDESEIDWNSIEAKLDESGNKSESKNARAEITNDVSNAAMGVVFWT